MTIPTLEVALTGERMMSSVSDDNSERPSRDEIARLAFHLYEMRGGCEGHDVDDWLSAERELRHHYR